MLNKTAKALLKKYREGTAAAEEINQLLNWVQQLKIYKQADFTEKNLEIISDKAWAKLSSYIKTPAQRKPWPRIAVAASIIFILFTAGYVLLLNKQEKSSTPNRLFSKSIVPGGNKAVLVLANQQKVTLSKAANGEVARQNNSVIKTADGTLKYLNGSETTDSKHAYNTLYTPRGGHYMLQMSDGSMAMLDASSSIKYPVNFNGPDRRVEITGQVFFEVKHNAKKPFKVQVGKYLIEDIGTQFNINAYGNEPAVKTTLLKGSVRVYSGPISKTIVPGQQAILKARDIRVLSVDAEAETAWIKGNFQFDNSDIESIMKQLSRWYDVDVKYDGDFKGLHFSGLVPKKNAIDEILIMMERTGNVRFKINGKTITVMR